DYGSEWLMFRAFESDASALGAQMSITVTLESPPGEDYDLYVYYNPGSDVPECASALLTSTELAGTVDSVYGSWGEGSIANNLEDGRDVAIEVWAVTASCTSSAQW